MVKKYLISVLFLLCLVYEIFSLKASAAVYRNGGLQSVKLKEISAPGEIRLSGLALENPAEDQMKIMLLSDPQISLVRKRQS